MNNSVYTVSWAIPTTCLLLVLCLLLELGSGCFGGFDPPKTAKKPPAKASGAKPTKPTAKTDAKKEPEQTYAEAWQAICEAERRSQADPAASRSARGAHVAAWIVEHLKNKKARYWFIALGNMKPPERLPHFLAEAKRAGFPDCPVAGLLFPAPAK